MFSKILQLTVGSCDLSQAEKKKYVLFLQAEEIHKMTTIITQIGQSSNFE